MTDRRTRRADDERGAVLPFVAVVLVVLVLMTSFAIDLGRARLRARDLQSFADVAALDAAKELAPCGTTSGLSRSECPVGVMDSSGIRRERPSDAYARVLSAAQGRSASRNAFTASRPLVVRVGYYDGASRTWTAYSPTDTTPDQPVNVAFVQASDRVDWLFQPGSGGATKRAAATPSKLIDADRCVGPACVPTTPTTPTVPTLPTTPGSCPLTDPRCRVTTSGAGDRVGSFLASIDQGIAQRTLAAGVSTTCGGDVSASAGPATSVTTLNCSISALYGVTTPAQALRLTAVGYQGLASSTVALGDLASALGFGTPEQLLAADVRRRDFVLALADVLNRSGRSDLATPLTTFGSTLSTTNDVQLDELIDVSASTPTGVLALARFSALDLLAGEAQVVNGDNLLRLDAIDLGPVAIAGMAVPVRARLDLAVIETPRFAYGAAGIDPGTGRFVTEATNGQVNVRLNLSFDQPGLGTISLPVTVVGAKATSGLAQLQCGETLLGHRAALQVDTRAAAAYIGQFADLRTSPAVPPLGGATNVDAVTATPIVRVSLTGGLSGGLPGVPLGGAVIELVGRSAVGVAGTVQDVTGLVSNDPTRNSATVGSPLVGDLGTSLLANLQIQPRVLGGITLDQAIVSQVTADLTATVAGLLRALDVSLLRPVLDGLGVRVGGADVSSPGAGCMTTTLP